MFKVTCVVPKKTKKHLSDTAQSSVMNLPIVIEEFSPFLTFNKLELHKTAIS